MYSLICAIPDCAAIFMSLDRRQRYCSDACRKRKLWLNRGIDLSLDQSYSQRWCWKRKCRHCEEEFLTEDGRVWYCGQGCKAAASRNGHRIGVIETCALSTCDNDFIKVHKTKYCSDECRAEAREERRGYYNYDRMPEQVS